MGNTERNEAWRYVQECANKDACARPRGPRDHRRATTAAYGYAPEAPMPQLPIVGRMIAAAIFLALLVLLALLTGCAPVGVAADAAGKQALLCAANATGPDRCQEVRNVEADNAACWDAQVYVLTGEHALPPEVLAEVAAVVSR